MPFSDFNQNIHNTAGRTTVLEHSTYDNRIPAFAQNLCVYSDASLYSEKIKENDILNSISYGLLIDSAANEVLFSKNAFEKIYPASITKLLTAYIALKYCNPEDVIVCTEDVSNITVPGAVLLGLKAGDTFTLDQALHLCLLSSYNDVAVAIAVHVSGSVEAFADLMNEEAKLLGANHSHFVNPSGLPDDNHYTTAYDLYLIFNEVIQNSFLTEVIQCKEYSTIYHDINNNEVNAKSINTNQFFLGNYNTPDLITIVGGKTGTTTEAGHCLILFVRDTTSNPYIALILNADTTDLLYSQMSELLSQCAN